MKFYFRAFAFAFLLLLSCVFVLSGCAGRRPSAALPLDANWKSEPAPAAAQIGDMEQFEGFSRKSFYLTMRDGVKIAVDLYLPDGLKPEQKIPTLLLMTRYFRTFDIRWPISEIAGVPEELIRILYEGYAIVRLDARGTGASFGSRPCPWSIDEVKDGAEVVDWIIAQPWSNQRVGAVGGSYEGTAAEFLMVNQHPAVKAVAPLFSLYDTYTDIAFPGGIHLSWFTRTWQEGNYAMDANDLKLVFKPAPFLTWGVPPVDGDRTGYYLKKAIKDHKANYRVHDEAMQLNYRDDMTPNGFNADRFSPHTYQTSINESNTAVYNVSGWFDGGYPHAAIKRFLTAKNPGKKLLLGPWSHGGDWHVRQHEDTLRTKFDMVAELLRFFDYHLKDIDTGLYHEPAVHYYTMGEDAWKTADTWPPQADRQKFYLAEGGALSFTSAAKAGADTYAIDHSAGTGPATRWTCLAKNVTVAYPNRKEADKKLLVYQSGPLESNREVTGHPIVRLWLSAPTKDAQVFVYLEDVSPEGEVGYVTEGMLRALHRKLSDKKPPYNSPVPYRTFERADALELTPGVPAELVFDLLPVSHMFKKGHKVRIAIAGADADYFRPLPVEPDSFTMHRGGKFPSHIDLPVVN